MTPQEAEESALNAVKERHPKGSEFEVTHTTTDFLDGILVFIEFYDKDGDDDESYVYIANGEVHVMTDFESVAGFVARHKPAPAAHRLLREMFQVGGIAGAIGIMITCAICYMLIVQQAKDVPQVLAGALTTILGFYFGTKTTRK
jgi:hypothetical protein